MKSLDLSLAIIALATLGLGSSLAQESALDPERVANSIPLDETAVANLRIETEVAEERDFEKTVFAIGRIEEIPANHSVLSSRVAGRVVELNVYLGDTVEQGDVLARIESRQPGDPPPTIELKAPRGGLVVASHVRLGEPVEPAKELLDISDRSTMWAIAKVPESEASQVEPGSKARIRIPALGREPIEATLMRYGVNADREAGTIEAIFELENPDNAMRPGMRAEFSLITDTRENVLAIPRTAVQGDPTGRVVFVKDFELPNVFVRAPVVLGEQNEDYVEVVNGLFPGDEVVTQGSYALAFAGSGTGLSLKEVLDAAHGHEHNEDGSELTEEQKAGAEQESGDAERGHEHDHSHGDAFIRFLQIYAGVMTLLVIAAAQQLWRTRRRRIAAA